MLEMNLLNPIEIWRPILGYENKYLVSNYGRIFSNKLNGLMKLKLTRDGYHEICLQNKKRKYIRVHRLVLWNFMSHIDSTGLQTNHKDGNKLNNYVSNLEWVTCSENQKHAIRIGLSKVKRGEELSNLTEKDVREIRTLWSTGKYTLDELSLNYPTGRNGIWYIVNKKTWRHIL